MDGWSSHSNPRDPKLLEMILIMALAECMLALEGASEVHLPILRQVQPYVSHICHVTLASLFQRLSVTDTSLQPVLQLLCPFYWKVAPLGAEHQGDSERLSLVFQCLY